MSSNGPFGFDPEEFDRVVREAGEGLRDALDGVGRFFTTSGERAGWANLFDEFSRYSRAKKEPETTARPATASGRSHRRRRRRCPHRTGVSDRTGCASREQEQHRPDPQGAVPAVRHRGQRAGRVGFGRDRLAHSKKRPIPANISMCAFTASRVVTAASGRGASIACVRRCGCPPRFARMSRCCSGVPGKLTRFGEQPPPAWERVAVPRSSSVR